MEKKRPSRSLGKYRGVERSSLTHSMHLIVTGYIRSYEESPRSRMEDSVAWLTFLGVLIAEQTQPIGVKNQDAKRQRNRKHGDDQRKIGPIQSKNHEALQEKQNKRVNQIDRQIMFSHSC